MLEFDQLVTMMVRVVMVPMGEVNVMLHLPKISM